VVHSEWDSLQRHAQNLYRAGDYDRALQIAQRALEMAEEDAGSEDPAVASSLGTLEMIYVAQGQYALAEPLCKRSLAIWETAVGRPS
jgi:tetratricopeptide (TPR) repeat protein